MRADEGISCIAWIGVCFLSCALYQIVNFQRSDQNCESKQELERLFAACGHTKIGEGRVGQGMNQGRGEAALLRYMKKVERALCMRMTPEGNVMHAL